MVIRALFIFVAIFFITSCGDVVSNVLDPNPNNYIYLEDLNQGKYLERAAKSSIKDFFSRIIANGYELEKSPYKWKVLQDTPYWIYYGTLKKAPNGEMMVENFYKVDAEQLKTLFPIYYNTDGSHIKAKLYYLFVHDIEQQRLRVYCDKRYKIEYDKNDIRLTKKGIEVKMNYRGKCYDDEVVNVKVKAILDPNSLELISKDAKITDKVQPEKSGSF